jgi:DNA-binding SARP family transcriptional activator/WD40 repeat protein
VPVPTQVARRYQPGIGLVDSVSTWPDTPNVAISLLGPVQVDSGAELSPRDRVVLSALAAQAGRVLSADQLADALWGEEVPRSGPKILQGCIVRLRRALGKDAIETTTAGYRITLVDEEIDVRQFERLLGRGQRLAESGEHERAAAAFAQALQLWRGPAFPDIDGWAPGRSEASRLEELRRHAQDSLLEAEIAAGRDGVASATALVTEDPLREHRWYLLALALYRSGRQADALGAVRRARHTLREELGLDPGPELVEIEQAILSHDPRLAPTPSAVPERSICPYKGLMAYDRGDAEWFFGRDDEVVACLHALNVSRLLAVVGPSGSGKSSLIRAGVVPALERAGRTVRLLVPGLDPAAALTTAMASAARDVVLVVDQLEELFMAGHPQEVVVHFLNRLSDIVSSGTAVIAVLRADQLGGLSVGQPFARLVEQGLHLLAPMTEDQLRAAIERPAEMAGLRLESGLVELLMRDIEREPGALPLLSHALAETWERREGRVLTVDGYHAAGGIRGAVAQSAERLYESLPEAQRTVLRSLLLRLVMPSPGGDPIVTRITWDVVGSDPERRAVTDVLVRARLVTADEHSVVLAHEAVARAWPRLRSWLDDDISGQQIMRHLTLAADDWNTRGRPNSELYRGGRLEAALDWRRRSTPDLTPVEYAYLDASAALVLAEEAAVAQHNRDQLRQNRRLRVAVAGIAVGLVFALVAGTLAVQRSREATRTATDAQVDQLVAQSVALRSTRRDLAALLAVEAHRIRPDASTRSALLSTFTGAPGFVGYRASLTDAGPVPLMSGHVLSDGRTLLASGVDAVVRAFDLNSGTIGVDFPPPGINASGGLLAVNDDERTVVAIAWQGSSIRGGRAKLNGYDVQTRRRLFPEIDVGMDAGAVAISPDGRYVAVSGSRNGRVLLVDTAAVAGIPEGTSIGGDTMVPGVREVEPVGDGEDFADVRRTAALAFRNDGMLVVGSEIGILRVIDPTVGKVIEQFSGAPDLTSNGSFALSPDDEVLVSAGPRGVVRWDVSTNSPLWDTPTGGDECVSLMVVPLTDSVLCGSRYGRVEALDLDTGLPTGVRYDMQRGEVSALTLTSDQELIELSRAEPVIARWRLDGSGPTNRVLPVDGAPRSFSSDGKLLIVDSPSRHDAPDFAVVDATSGGIVDSLDGYFTPVWTNEPSRLVAWQSGGQGHVLDIRKHEPVRRLDGGLGGAAPDSGITSAGSDFLLAWGRPEGKPVMAAWDLRSGKYAGRVLQRVGDAGSLTADGELMVVMYVGLAGMATRDVRTGEQLATRSDVVNAGVSPAGVVAASTIQGRLSFYDPRSLEPTGPSLAGTPGFIEQFAFNTDGTLLGTRGGDGAVRLIDVDDRIQLGDTFELGTEAASIALRPDGLELALPSSHGIVLWSLDPASWIDAACNVAGRNLTPTEWSTHLTGHDYRETCPSFPPAE